MDRADTTRFIREAKSFAKRKRWKLQTLSRRIFNGNPYGLERLEAALRGGPDAKSGPPHVRVLEAVEAFRKLREEEEEERAAA